MQIKHLSIEPYEQLLKTLEADLCKVEQEDEDGDQYRKAIPVVASAINELRKMASGGFKNEDEEIAFFRDIWPAFYAWQFYYIEMHRFAFVSPCMPAEEVARMITDDEKKIANFFKDQSHFWPSYISNSPFINKEFTRSYSQTILFDPLSLVIDHEFSTIASYKAARGLGYKKYFDFLQQQKPFYAERTAGKTNGWKFEWRESRSAAVEWIKALALAESVYVNGAPATTAQLVTRFEEGFGMDLRDFNKLLYAADARKTDATPYLTKLINAFKGRKVMLRK